MRVDSFAIDQFGGRSRYEDYKDPYEAYGNDNHSFDEDEGDYYDENNANAGNEEFVDDYCDDNGAGGPAFADYNEEVQAPVDVDPDERFENEVTYDDTRGQCQDYVDVEHVDVGLHNYNEDEDHTNEEFSNGNESDSGDSAVY